MRAGDLNRKIVISQMLIVEDAQGNETRSQATIAALYASIKQESSGDGSVNGNPAAVDVKIFRIRWRSDITNGMWIDYAGNRYQISTINEFGRREGLDLTARAVIDRHYFMHQP